MVLRGGLAGHGEKRIDDRAYRSGGPHHCQSHGYPRDRLVDRLRPRDRSRQELCHQRVAVGDHTRSARAIPHPATAATRGRPGNTRTFLLDGDDVIIRAHARRDLCDDRFWRSQRPDCDRWLSQVSYDGGRRGNNPFSPPFRLRSMTFCASSVARLRSARFAASPTSIRTASPLIGPLTDVGSVTRPPSCA
jgi:hypothetical protein